MKDQKIPESVTAEEMSAALEPLCELLNITTKHLFAAPVVLDGHQIIFAIPAPASVETWLSDHPSSRPADIRVQAGEAGEGAELAQVVRVQVIQR